MSTKQLQGKLWSAAPQYWSMHFEPSFLPMYKKVLGQLKVSRDTLLLDAGCGSGLFSYMAIQQGAVVMGIDAAAGLLEVARQRNPRNNFLEEDLEELPFTGDSFDVITAFNSLQYASKFQVALNEVKRVLKPEGKLVIAIWDSPEENEATTVVNAIRSLLPPPPPGTPGPFTFSDDGNMETIFRKSGLKMVYKARVGCPLLYNSLTEGIKSFMGTGPAAAAINYTNEMLVKETIANALQPYHLTEDMYHLQNHFLVYMLEK